jgi:hypothetical protein
MLPLSNYLFSHWKIPLSVGGVVLLNSVLCHEKPCSRSGSKSESGFDPDIATSRFTKSGSGNFVIWLRSTALILASLILLISNYVQPDSCYSPVTKESTEVLIFLATVTVRSNA